MRNIKRLYSKIRQFKELDVRLENNTVLVFDPKMSSPEPFLITDGKMVNTIPANISEEHDRNAQRAIDIATGFML